MDLFVYAPLGLLFNLTEVVPQLAEKGKKQVQMARMLRGFGIKSQNIWINGKVPKGYYTADILAAQNRYSSAIDPLGPLGEKKDNNMVDLEAIFLALRSARENASKETDPLGSANEHDSGDFNTADEGWEMGQKKVVRR